MFKYVLGIPSGALLPDVVAQQETADAMQIAKRCSEDFALHMAQLARGIVMIRRKTVTVNKVSSCLREPVLPLSANDSI